MPDDAVLRKQLIETLRKSDAHPGFENAVKDFPRDQRGVRPKKSPHSAWELLEHLRLAQKDILEFSLSEDYKPRTFPDDYWPAAPEPKSAAAWTKSVSGVLADREAFLALIDDPKRDLFAPFPWGEGQTLLREALLIIDHNAFHVGQIVLVRRLLGIWPG
jgi:DinB superfamily